MMFQKCASSRKLQEACCVEKAKQVIISRQSTLNNLNFGKSNLLLHLTHSLGLLLLALVLLASATQEISNAAPIKLATLEAELDGLLEGMHDGASPNPEINNKLLTEAIISRLMLSNLSDSSQLANTPLGVADLQIDTQASQTGAGGDGEQNQNSDYESGEQQQQAAVFLSGPESLRLRKLMSFLHNFGLNQAAGGINGGQVFNQYPILPSGQAGTIKRAGLKMGSYLKQQQQANARQSTAGYGARNQFDFGLGKRPDSSVSSKILRFGDSSMGAGGHIVSGGLGKRPSAAHRFDFGLGKRVASPAYPRYDFGLGKRAPNRIRYDFGLGK